MTVSTTVWLKSDESWSPDLSKIVADRGEETFTLSFQNATIYLSKKQLLSLGLACVTKVAEAEVVTKPKEEVAE